MRAQEKIGKHFHLHPRIMFYKDPCLIDMPAFDPICRLQNIDFQYPTLLSHAVQPASAIPH
jgi:hypothetical protein